MKIDVIQSDKSHYGTLSSFTSGLAEALIRQGVEVRVFEECPDYVKSPPDFTLSFFRVSLNTDVYPWDLYKIPHIHYSVDRIEYLSELPKSPYLILTADDRIVYKMLKEMGYKQVLFLPHATDRELVFEPDAARPYEITFFGTCSFAKLVADFLKTLSEPILEVLNQAVAITLSDLSTSYQEAFLLACRRADIPHHVLARLDLATTLKTLDFICRLKDRLRLLRSIRRHPVHVFGDALDTVGWKEVLEGQDNILVHPGVSFEEALKIMKQSRLTLNSIPTLKQGAHERIFYAYACGALPVTNENLFLKEYFEDQKNILFYPPLEEDLKGIDAFLKDEALRVAAVQQGRAIVLAHHTWDARAKVLIDALKKRSEGLEF